MSQQQQPDIFIVFSDQHNALVNGFAGDAIVRTPNLDRLAAEGTVFDAAYTSCPLCVPARVGFMSGHAAGRTGVFSNAGALRGDQATWAHALGAAGYETVLVGRMHFVGPDQRCGFERRPIGDCVDGRRHASPQAREFGELIGEYGPTRGMGHCLEIIGGGGVSPVLKYDELVVDEALRHLGEDPDRPQCTVVGTYAPHFPYVAPKDLYLDYKERVSLPASYHAETNYDVEPITRRGSEVDEETVRAARAAYYAMVENLDRQIGQLREAWEERLARTGREGIFIYISDHGDTIGEHKIYGKQTHLEGSCRIPLVVAGAGVAAGARVSTPVSITDLCTTLCEAAGAEAPPQQDGRSLWPELRGQTPEPDRHVYAEWFDLVGDDQPCPSRMVRRGKWKYIHYAAAEVADLLFDLEADPAELHNRAGEEPAVAAELLALARRDWDPEGIAETVLARRRHVRIITHWAFQVHPDNPDLCVDSVRGLALPEVR